MNRLQQVATRMGPDLRDAMEAMPGLGGIALWVKFCDDDDPTLVAQTDGVRVTAGPRYCNYAAAERRFIVLHELLHVALAHPVRARELEKRVAGFDRELYNIACDALINAALKGVHGIRQPADATTLDRVLSQIGLWQPNDDISKVVRQWSSEALYHALAKQRDQLDLSELANANGFGSNDLVPTGGASTSVPNSEEGCHSTEDALRTWHGRWQMARGALANILTRLTKELPQVKTPWERLLRDLLFRHAQRKRQPDPARPTRRWLALENELRQNEGVLLPFERATRPARSGRIALAVDTSGSVDETLLKRFAAEVAAVLEQTEPHLRLIVCDADVHQVCDFTGREATRQLRDFKFKGGGGTDFRPAIAEAARWKPDLLIYLTDLAGIAGDQPAFPVVWAVPEGEDAAPWGKVIELTL